MDEQSSNKEMASPQSAHSNRGVDKSQLDSVEHNVSGQMQMGEAHVPAQGEPVGHHQDKIHQGDSGQEKLNMGHGETAHQKVPRQTSMPTNVQYQQHVYPPNPAPYFNPQPPVSQGNYPQYPQMMPNYYQAGPQAPRMQYPNTGGYPFNYSYPTSPPRYPHPRPAGYPNQDYPQQATPPRYQGYPQQATPPRYQGYPQQATPPRYPVAESPNMQSPNRFPGAGTQPQRMECPEDTLSSSNIHPGMPQQSHVEEHVYPTEEDPTDTDKSKEESDKESESSTSSESDDEEVKGLHVEGLSNKITEKSLRSYFGNRRKSGGGEVASLTYEDKQKESAIIYFKQEEAIDRIIQKAPHLIDKKQVTVSVYKPEKNEEESSSASEEEKEEEHKTIEIRGFNTESTDDTFTFYFENPRKGGGEIADFNRNNKDGVIYITFENVETVDTVMQKSPHSIGKKQLQVSVYTPDKKRENRMKDSSSDSEKEEVEYKTIEVRGFKEETSDDTLRFYFENPRKGGGDIDTFQRKDEAGVIYITFADVEVAKNVAEKSHKIGKCVLQVKLFIPPPPRPSYKDRLLITGLKDTTTKDCLINFLEAKSSCDIDDSDVVYGEEVGTALVRFNEMPDLEKLQRVCVKKPLEGSYLTISKVPISNSIIVHGLKPTTSEDTVTLYFEGKRSGNVDYVEVEKIIMKPDEGCSLVYFVNHTVIEKILDKTKRHKLDEATLSVSIYHECLGVGGGVHDPTWFKMPSPVEVKNLDRHKLHFIKESKSSMEALLKKLTGCHTEITWSKVDDAAVVLTCTLTKQVRNARLLSRSWTVEAEKALKDYLLLLEVEEIRVLRDIWDDVEKQLDNRHTEGASMFVFKDLSSIVVVGCAKFGKDMAEKVKSLVKNVEEAYQKKKLEISETINKLKPIQLKLLLASGFPKLIMSRNPELNVNISIKKNEITFHGIIGDVKNTQVEMYESLQSTKESKLTNLSKGLLEMVDKKNVRDHIVKKMKNKNLVGVWEVSQKELTVLAFSDADAVEVVHMIKTCVTESIQPLDPESVILLSSDKWSDLTRRLLQEHGETLTITHSSDNNSVVITAINDIISFASEEVSNFFSENTIFSQTVKFPKATQRFLQQHQDKAITQIVSDLKGQQVQIRYAETGKEFTIKATKIGMDLAMKRLEDLAGRVMHRQYVHKRPGIRKLLESTKGSQFIANLEYKERCIIEKDFDNSETTTVGNQHVLASTTTAAEGVKIIATCTMPKNRKLYFVEGDITEMKVDVIINAANENLDHIGGLARAIVEKGGRSIQTECNRYVSANGKVVVGSIAKSQSGNLPCKMIVHAVGPVWSGGHSNEEELLRDAIFNSLEATEMNNFASIAMPALSCGIYHYPIADATTAIVDAIKEHFENVTNSSVGEVYLVDRNVNTVSFFVAAARQAFGNHSVNMEEERSVRSSIRHSFKPIPSPRKDFQAKRKSTRTRSSKPSDIKIHLVKGEIAKQQADVIVNSTSNNLDLQNGAVSKSILAVGGSSLQKECRKKYPSGIQPGSFAVTSGGNLSCNIVYHTCLPNWSNDQTSKQLLYNLVTDCLKKASKAGSQSIAFPALGTGNLGYPRDIVATCIQDSVNDFGSKNPNSSLKDVMIVVYDKDTATIQAFESQLTNSNQKSNHQPSESQLTNSNQKSNRRNRKFGECPVETDEAEFEMLSSSDLSHGFKMGSVTLSVKQGDLTQENVDCIVNSTNKELNFSQGGVSLALAKACGQSLVDECKKKLKKMQKNGIISTNAEGLGCKAIIHVDTKHFNDNWQNVISKCLSEAENIPGVTSLAFPALGTGVAKSASDEVAEAFVNAVYEYQKSSSILIGDVRIVIFQADMLQSFTNKIQKVAQNVGRSGFLASVAGKVAGMFGFGTKHDQVVQQAENSFEMPLHYFSNDPLAIDGCIQQIESYSGNEINEKVIEDPALKSFRPSQIESIANLEKDYQVKVTYQRDHGRMTIQGMAEDVWNAHDVLQKLLREVDRHEQELQKAEILSNLVQWYYIETDTQGQEIRTKYDKDVNAIIEKAYCDKCPTVTLTASTQKYIIDFSALEEYPANDRSDFVKVERKDLLKESAVSAFDPPSHWIPMGVDEELKVVPLQISDAGFQTVSKDFLSSVNVPSATIIKIEQIQNKTLYQQYVAKKNQISKHCTQTQTAESKLWHGTSDDAIISVNTHGFNRSYCGKNATAFGDGVYFAVDARYSASNTYSRPNSQGHKHMYYSSVLTGDFAQGQGGMRVPPPKSSTPSLLYDSVVDKTAKPGMFIIFNDTQAYPDYLITFTV